MPDPLRIVHIDYAPVKNTCPMIDEVISVFDEVDFSDTDYKTQEEAIYVMEKIREANSSLREWGNEMHNEAREYKRECEDLRREITALKEKQHAKRF